jgi:hypothetical protein
MRRPIIAAAIVAAGLATAGIAYAETQPADPSVGASPAAAAKAGRQAGALKAGVLKGAIHGDLLVLGENGSTRTVTFDRGKITAIDAGSISINRPDGVSVTKTLTDQTVFNGTPRDKLQVGTAAVVVSSGDTAERVISKGDRGPRPEKRKERLEKRQEQLEKRQERRAGKGAGAGESPAAGPSSMVDDGFETILS